MAIYPRGRLKLLPEAGSQPLITATQIILHTAVSPSDSLYPYFARDDVRLESHFYVATHAVEQYVNTARSADANYHANIRAISIESWDNGDPEHTPWTTLQLDMLTDLCVWLCQTHHIPAVRCPRWDLPGIGYHSMWGAPSDWTPARGKTCPDKLRIAQFPSLLDRIQRTLNLPNTPPQPPTPIPPKETDMAFMVSNPKGATLIVTGNASLLVTSAEMAANHTKAGIPTVHCDDNQFSRYEKMRIDTGGVTQTEV